jgi:hypothetical protein
MAGAILLSVERLICMTVVDNVYAIVWKQPRSVPTPHLGQVGLAELVFHRPQMCCGVGSATV